MKIKDKLIWITGASSGIGKALAEELASRGAKLILSARNEQQLQALQSSLPNSQLHHVVPLDLAEADSLAAVARLVDESIGPVDILINNGGISQRSTALATRLEVQRKVMEVNYFGTIALTTAVAPQIIKNGGGMVVNIASVAGKVGGKSMAGYSGSKHALIGYMDCLRAEESLNGLQVLNICPGYVQTAISVNAMTASGEQYGKVARTIADGITPEQCARQIVKAILGDKEEVVIGHGLSYWAPMIKRFFPATFRKIVARGNFRES
jgi:short-subunit dehydrogenase